MTQAKTPFEMMMTQAQEMAQAMNPAMSSFDPKGFDALWPTMPKDMLEMWFGKGLSKNGLDAKTRLLLTLAGMTMQGAQSETPYRLTLRHAREAGASDEEIAETIAHMAMFAGVPAMSRGMEMARDVMNDTKDPET